MMIRFKHRGNFNKIQKWLNRMSGAEYLNILEKYGRIGVDALAASTPIDSGETAKSWDFVIERGGSRTTIYWTNTHIQDGVNIALILQYGHGTGTGGYVQGRDYINPAIRPIFDKIAEDLWKEVTRE
jgi:hypothetical protein